MLGSIFSEKLRVKTVLNSKYRTAGLNPALTTILQKFKELQKEKTGNIVISENVSGMCRSQDSFRTFKEFDWASLSKELRLTTQTTKTT